MEMEASMNEGSRQFLADTVQGSASERPKRNGGLPSNITNRSLAANISILVILTKLTTLLFLRDSSLLSLLTPAKKYNKE